MSDNPNPTPDDGGKPDEGKGQEQTFTQAEVDKIVKDRADRLYRQRVGDLDIDELVARAAGAKTAEERITELEKSIEAANREALRRRVQAAHGISDEDADLFLTGTDEESLTAQAKRLSDRDAERKQKNNVSPREGNNPKPDKDDPMREFTRGLFQRATSD